jgi:hypothetical protein
VTESARQKAAPLLWLAIPVCCGVLYPFARTDTRTIEWLTIALIIYVLFFSVVIHELCHGIAARFCG